MLYWNAIKYMINVVIFWILDPLDPYNATLEPLEIKNYRIFALTFELLAYVILYSNAIKYTIKLIIFLILDPLDRLEPTLQPLKVENSIIFALSCTHLISKFKLIWNDHWNVFTHIIHDDLRLELPQNALISQ